MKRFLSLLLVLAMLTAAVPCFAEGDGLLGSLWGALSGGLGGDPGESAGGSIDDWLGLDEGTGDDILGMAGDIFGMFTDGEDMDLSDWGSLFSDAMGIAGDFGLDGSDLLSGLTDLFDPGEGGDSGLSQELYDLFIGLCTDLGMEEDDAAVLWNSLADYAEQKGINAGSLLELCSMLLIRTEAGDSGKQWLYDIADDFVQGTVNDCFCTDDLFRLLTGALVSMGVNNSKSAGAALRALWKAFED